MLRKRVCTASYLDHIVNTDAVRLHGLCRWWKGSMDFSLVACRMGQRTCLSPKVPFGFRPALHHSSHFWRHAACEACKTWARFQVSASRSMWERASVTGECVRHAFLCIHLFAQERKNFRSKISGSLRSLTNSAHDTLTIPFFSFFGHTNFFH